MTKNPILDELHAVRERLLADAVGEGFGSPVLGVRQGQEFAFWAAASGITGGPKRPPVPPQNSPPSPNRSAWTVPPVLREFESM